MPHLSSLAKKYNEVAFIGVDASEDTDSVTTAQKFVDVSKDMMAYHVAYATPKGAMHRDWLRGQGGIPTAFVVDARRDQLDRASAYGPGRSD
jgi:thiol-disulfide isomerase/thioredoxin